MQVDSQFIAAVDASPLDFDIVFFKPSDTTHYDIKSFQAENPFAGFAGPGDPTSPSTGFDRYNSREINMLRAEMEPGGNISRLMLEFDRTTQVLKMEYFLYAASGGDVTFYRLYLDQTNDIAKLFSYKGQTGAGADWTRYTVVGKPVAGGTIAVSLDRHGSGLTGGYDRQACVTIADGAIASGNDNSLACTLTGVDGDAAEAAIFPNGASALATEAALGVNSSWLDITETMSITWGVDTIYTQAVSY
jgi:hypothetical protein